ncbi:MAG: chalcone isomerase family protein, partial [Gallionella sp.]
VLHMLRELSSERLFSAFNEGILENHSANEIVVLGESLKQMKQIFDTMKAVKTGDVITLDYLPDSGTHISVNGAALGTIEGVEFKRAMLKIWLGSKPVQEELKKGLLSG